MAIDRNDLIYDWNSAQDAPKRPETPLHLNDETLRDGLQSPSARNPLPDEKISLLHLMQEIGLQGVNIGFPAAGGRSAEDALLLAKTIAQEKMTISANAPARTVESDVRAVVELSQKAGLLVETAIFTGSSLLRRYTERWSGEEVLRRTRDCVALAAGEGLPVMFVTEDTSRTPPDEIRRLYLTAIEAGATRLCLSDTAGYATPPGVRRLVRHVRRLLDKEGLDGIQIDFHGHMDRGLGIWNGIAAFEAGADRVHATALGIGERVGNLPLDLLLVNLNLLGWWEKDLAPLPEYCRRVSEWMNIIIPRRYPVFGQDAFTTATGTHAAAFLKALEKDEAWIADRIYTSVPATEFGREHDIAVGPLSGKSNVRFWLKRHGETATDEQIEAVLAAAKKSRTTLTDEEIKKELKRKG